MMKSMNFDGVNSPPPGCAAIGRSPGAAVPCAVSGTAAAPWS
jgi:hypothetical protein